MSGYLPFCDFSHRLFSNGEVVTNFETKTSLSPEEAAAAVTAGRRARPLAREPVAAGPLRQDDASALVLAQVAHARSRRGPVSRRQPRGSAQHSLARANAWRAALTDAQDPVTGLHGSAGAALGGGGTRRFLPFPPVPRAGRGAGGGRPGQRGRRRGFRLWDESRTQKPEALSGGARPGGVSREPRTRVTLRAGRQERGRGSRRRGLGGGGA